MYDYFLGGAHNFAVDRRAAEQVLTFYPEMPLWAQANRAFLRRAVGYLAAQGVEQFLDIGSGIPTVGSVHQVAQAANPAARVVYADIDPVAVAHSQAILRDNPQAIAVEADVRQAAQLLRHAAVQRVLDPARPIAALLVAVLPFVMDDTEALRLVRELSDALPTGSYVVIAHVTAEGSPAEVREKFLRLYASTSSPGGPRPRSVIGRFFEGLELVEPGLVYAPLWRPESSTDLYFDEPGRAANFVGVGRTR
jgi:hypothetical protein